MGGLSITAAGSGATGSTSGAATSSASTPALCWPSLEDGGREKTAIEGTEEQERGYADTGPNNAGTDARWHGGAGDVVGGAGACAKNGWASGVCLKKAILNNAKPAPCSCDHGTVNGNNFVGSQIIERSQLVALLLADKDSVTKRKNKA